MLQEKVKVKKGGVYSLISTLGSVLNRLSIKANMQMSWQIPNQFKATAYLRNYCQTLSRALTVTIVKQRIALLVLGIGWMFVSGVTPIGWVVVDGWSD